MPVSASLAVRRLVIDLCANHSREQSDVRDYCCLEWTQGNRCVLMLETGARCGYFERSVLPVDRRLEALYWAERRAQAGGYRLTQVQACVALDTLSSPVLTCERCGKQFEAASNRQKYCPPCRKAVANEQKRLSKAKRIATGV